MTLLLFNKPFDVLSQFTDDGHAGQRRANLSDFIEIPNVYPCGRLDKDSEGLLILTDDGKLQSQISDPRYKTEKSYLVQVEGVPDSAALSRLRNGVELKDGITAKARARNIEEPAWLWPRSPPIRYRKSKPDSWIEITITEGRNRQVRRMTAAVGFPTLRLIRWSIGRWSLNGLASGEWIRSQA